MAWAFAIDDPNWFLNEYENSLGDVFDTSFATPMVKGVAMGNRVCATEVMMMKIEQKEREQKEREQNEDMVRG